MAAATAQPASKSSKKKAAKTIERTESPAPSFTSGADKTGDDQGNQSPYIKELQKYVSILQVRIKGILLTSLITRNIRNVNKKIVSVYQSCQCLPMGTRHP